VRKEYEIYPDEQYNLGRKGVLESFIKRKKIFLTKEFKKYEKRARKNLQDEINLYLCKN
jgi:predicted metal-dependent HD superfamily phosphohydrolase